MEYDLRTRYEFYSDLKSKNYTITIPPSSHLNDKVNDVICFSVIWIIE